MRRSNWTPSIVPNDNDETVYLVADDFGRLGRAWREADYETTDLETVIQDLLTGQFANTAERWSEDVSEDVANELRRRCDLQMRELPSTISDFVERHEDRLGVVFHCGGVPRAHGEATTSMGTGTASGTTCVLW